MRAFPLFAAIAIASVACTVAAVPSDAPAASNASISSPTATPLAATPSASVPKELGAPLSAGERPSAAECERMLRSDRAAARRIRKELQTSRLRADEDTIEAAAADPAADVSLLGIPATEEEIATLRGYGIALAPRNPIAGWVHVGRSDLFGGIWVDPPGTESFVVSVVDGLPSTLSLGRCLERDGMTARYVVAHRSWAELLAMKDRIG